MTQLVMSRCRRSGRLALDGRLRDPSSPRLGRRFRGEAIEKRRSSMSSDTRPARLELVSSQNGMPLLLVDQQEGLVSKVHTA